MIVECPRCESRVDAEAFGEVELPDPDGGQDPAKAVLLKCSICQWPILAATELVQVGPSEWDWGELSRLWPDPNNGVAWDIPEIARNSLVEATICFKAKAYSACAVMAGRAVEGACKRHNVKARNLAGGLRELKEMGLIDERIFEWGDELRKHRNLGAHASEERIAKEDARDLLDFALAICDHVFILRTKFERFQERSKKRRRGN